MHTPTTRKLRLCALCAAMIVAGCATAPAYQAPHLPLSGRYAGAPALAARGADQPAPPLERWWSGFQDPALERIIERVLAQNLDLAAALARVDQARAAARIAGSRELPSVGLQANALRQHQSLESPLGKIASSFPGYQRNQSIYDAGVGASWELDLAGGLAAGTRQAQAMAQAAEADRLGVRVSVAAEAADSYFRVRAAQRRIALAQEQIKTNAGLLKLVRLRLADGLASTRDVAQAEALLAQASATVPPLRTELALQLNRLDVLMGVQPGTHAGELSAPADAQTLPAVSVALGPADLLRRRPDVIAAERRLAAADASVGVATAEYYPHVTLGALVGIASLGSANLLSAAALQPQATLGLRWRLFDFGRLDAEVAQAKGAKAENLASYRQSMLRATEDVENAIVTLTELEQQRRELEQEVSSRLHAHESTEEGYKGGALSLFEVLDEERQLLTARDQLTQVHADNARAVVRTFRALGGGW
jgi:NodT family efflux transporter outer membrane factor (OMF) lipoprotein